MAHRFCHARRMTGLAAALSLLLTGCIPIAYVYPSVGFIPPSKLGSTTDEVRAFRVEIAEHYKGVLIRPPAICRSTFREVPCSPEGHVTSQTQLALGHGRYQPGVWGPWSATHPTFELRLYRPGWKTVRVSPWQLAGAEPWEPASTLADQEQAVDWLLFACEYEKVPEAKVFTRDEGALFDWDGSRAALMPGSTSSAHRQFLLFAAGEYERLAGLAPEGSQKVQLNLKAQKLRNLADE